MLQAAGTIDAAAEPTDLIAAAASGYLGAFEHLYRQISPRVYGLCLRLTGQREAAAGSRLSFKNGEGHGSVRINTKSGDVRLCAKDTSSGRSSALSLAQTRRSTVMVPYVY
jgi:hypothetical protein